MREDQLADLLRSPALSLEPPPDLVSATRAGARRVRRRRQAGAGALAATALAVAGLTVPGLVGDGGGRAPDVAAAELRERFPHATSSIEVLEQLNGGRVVTFYSGTRWCTASTRTLVNDGCRGYVAEDPVAPFALYLPAGDPSLRVDDERVTAGVLGTGVARVEVELLDGPPVRARTVSGDGFPRPVWWVHLPADAVVTGYRSYDDAGTPLSGVSIGMPAAPN